MQSRLLTAPPGRGIPAAKRPAKRPATLAELVDSTPDLPAMAEGLRRDFESHRKLAEACA